MPNFFFTFDKRIRLFKMFMQKTKKGQANLGVIKVERGQELMDGMA